MHARIRADLASDLEDLADTARQERVWLPGGNAADIDFQDTIEDFFISTRDTFDLPWTGVGEILYSFKETLALDRVRAHLDLVLDETKDADDRPPAVLRHEHWPQVVTAARRALEVMRRYDDARLEPLHPIGSSGSTPENDVLLIGTCEWMPLDEVQQVLWTRQPDLRGEALREATLSLLGTLLGAGLIELGFVVKSADPPFRPWGLTAATALQRLSADWAVLGIYRQRRDICALRDTAAGRSIAISLTKEPSDG